MAKDKENLYELEVALCSLVGIVEDAVGKEEFEKLDNAGADIIDCLAELKEYRAIGTVEELKSLKENGAFSGIELAQIASMQMKLKEYQSIGTIDEFKSLKEKSVAKKQVSDVGGCIYNNVERDWDFCK